ncbi:MAG: hypothetical protein D3906_02600 [Candidatus Electrothrix sp. AUS1_2]|nr:hypothetical protein [Candidatus Electrothrix sp. AUS1_2]
MIFSFNPVVNFIVSLFNKYVVDSSLKYIAYKALLYTSLVVVLPAVVKNLFSWLFGLLTSQVNGFDWGSVTSIVVQLNGVGAYLAVHLRFLDCFSVLVTALVIRLTLNFIPFIG